MIGRKARATKDRPVSYRAAPDFWEDVGGAGEEVVWPGRAEETSLFWLGVPGFGDPEAVPVGAAVVPVADPVGAPLGLVSGAGVIGPEARALVLLGELDNVSEREVGPPVADDVGAGDETDGSTVWANPIAQSVESPQGVTPGQHSPILLSSTSNTAYTFLRNVSPNSQLSSMTGCP
jgi:hypothetical protein